MLATSQHEVDRSMMTVLDELDLTPRGAQRAAGQGPASEAALAAALGPTEARQSYSPRQLAAAQARAALNRVQPTRRRRRRLVRPALPMPTLRWPALSRRLVGHSLLVTLALFVALGGQTLHVEEHAAAGGALPSRNAAQPQADLEYRPISLLTYTRSWASEGAPEQDALHPMSQPMQVRWSPAFTQDHEVQPGETLGEIAERYGISVMAVAASNGLLDTPLLAIGQQLRIPQTSGVPHVLGPNETLEEIAARYEVSLAALIGYAPNNLVLGDLPPAGTEIFIPGAVYPAEGVTDPGAREATLARLTALPVALVREDESNMRSGPGTRYQKLGQLLSGTPVRLLGQHDGWFKILQPSGEAAWMASEILRVPDAALADVPETTDFPPPPPIWVWPTYGDVTSGFGWRSTPWRMFHDGLDIANSAGTPIYAASDGTVIEAGWCSGFGWCVKMAHDGGLTTIYGHQQRRPIVAAGDYVIAGEQIGYMGSTYDLAGGGYSTGNHLHFTVKQDGVAVNPFNYLP